jgi:hypothetical protein
MAEVYKAGDVSQKRVYTFDLKGKPLELESLAVEGTQAIPTADPFLLDPAFDPGMVSYGVYNVGRTGAGVKFTVRKKSGYTLEVYRQLVRQPDPAPGADPNLLEYTIDRATTSEAQVGVTFKLVTPLNEYVNYAVTMFVPQEEGDTNPNLMNLQAWRGETLNTGEQLIQQFDKERLTYSVSPENSSGQWLAWKAQAQSKASGVTITAKLDGNPAPNTSTLSTDKILTGKVQFPTGTDQNVYKNLEITVTQGDGQANRTWTIQLGSYKLKDVIWKGTAEYGGTDKQIAGITGRNAAGAVISAENITLKAGGLVEWDIKADESWLPESFLITLVDVVSSVYYESTAIFPSTTAINASKPSAASGWETPASSLLNLTPLAITADDVGNRIYDAKDFFEKLGGVDVNGDPLVDGNGDPIPVDTSTNYSLANNINLAGFTESDGTPRPWKGPSGYSGHLFGNGYTISGLVLTANSGTNEYGGRVVGLFSSLGDGATLENFTLEVSTPGSQPIDMNGPSLLWFGGVLGVVNSPSTITLKKIKVKGNLNINRSGHSMVGGFFGEMKGYAQVTLEQCSSEVNISFSSTGNISNPDGNNVGGFVGYVYGAIAEPRTVSFTDCYATGNITYTSTGDTNNRAGLGGFVGAVYNLYTGVATILFDRCYASGNVAFEGPTGGALGAGPNYVYTAGFLGAIRATSTRINLTLQNCAAVGEKALLKEAAMGTGSLANSRFAAFLATDTSGATFINNVANSGMLLGDGTPASIHSDDSADQAGTTHWGKGVSLTNLKSAATWTGGLGWDPAIWDFAGLSKSGSAFYWPRLR